MLEWITALIEQGGYLAIALLMFVENVFPPIPSELIMPLSGFTASRGELDIFLVILAGTAGSLAGATAWYWIGRLVSAGRLKVWADRHGRWLTVAPEDIDRADAWFDRHGRKAVFIGRLVPTVRTLISIPAGLSGMALMPFLAYSALGTVIWSGLLAGAGYLLEERYDRVAAGLNPLATAVLVALAGYYVYRVATFRRRERRPRSARNDG